ncbi:MAG: 1-deoxy-D-xylulose-5-phosphate reductoisomerase [Planctomycetes bacterium TMED75]|nr:1-deoxy-D-xylulose-5-phosphate reductoisomerase [Planctomycetaceae bacterium]OUU96134.1 MAG: 1-deoxy-D-xylulose-5-phosphate reductoisomerase [Planctomycetes bacterium TMED75]
MMPYDGPNSTERTGRIIVLGSTGSIGMNTLEVVRHLRDHCGIALEVAGLAAGRQTELLARQAAEFQVDHVATVCTEALQPLQGVAHVASGPDAAMELIDSVAQPGDFVVGAIVGAAGVGPCLAALQKGCDLGLANKEALVAAGMIVMEAANKSGARVIPIDSEHSAIFQCLQAGRRREEVSGLILTASGGPFREWDTKRMRGASVEEALNHPTWSMGRKVTIDSASLMNKALELIEARWLFGMVADQLQAIIHPQSIVHSFVEFVDHSVIAQLSPPDMRLPIQYALTWPDRVSGCADRTDFSAFSDLIFEPIDHEKFPAINTALEVIAGPDSAGAIFNAANEVAVEAFLEGRIAFGSILDSIRTTLERCEPGPITTLEEIWDIDREARRITLECLASTAGT